jgi:alpha-galactosidase
MIPLAHICQRNCDNYPDRWTRLSRDEQLTLMSMLAVAPSPLMLGMNLPDNDPWTTALLTNPEVLFVNQDPLGVPARRRPCPSQPAEVWMKGLADGSTAIGVFNRGDKSLTISLPWRHLGFLSVPALRDLWLRKDLDRQPQLASVLPPHGCLLLKVRP